MTRLIVQEEATLLCFVFRWQLVSQDWEVDCREWLRCKASPQTVLRKIPSMLPLLLLPILRRRSPHQILADHCAVIPIRVVRVGLGIDRHFTVARHRPSRPAPSAGTSIHRFAVGSHRRVPEENVLVGDGFALGDAVAFAVGDGAVEGVWVGV